VRNKKNNGNGNGKKLPLPSSSTHHKSSSNATATTSLASSEDTPRKPASSQFDKWMKKKIEDPEYMPPVPASRKRKAPAAWNGDDLYDLDQPSDLTAYRSSVHTAETNRLWKDRIYAGSRKQQSRRASTQSSEHAAHPAKRQRALNFAPPAPYDAPGPSSSAPSLPLQHTSSSATPTPPPIATTTQAPSPSANPDAKLAKALGDIAAVVAKNKAKKAAADAIAVSSTPPAPSAASSPQPNVAQTPASTGSSLPVTTISRAPVMYDTPEVNALRRANAASSDSGKESDGDGRQSAQKSDTRRSNRPAKEPTIAERMMQNMGWQLGEGLGAEGEGIQTALQVQMKKGGKTANIVGGKKNKPKDDMSGLQSMVIKFPALCKGMDTMVELRDHGLAQKLGEYFTREYGKVERVFVYRRDIGGNDDVFVKFASESSAVLCVTQGGKRIDEGFVGPQCPGATCEYFDLEKFEACEYE
jgi:splicing factor 45